MKLRDQIIVKEYFKEYYILNKEKIATSIHEINSREFAYVDFDNIMHRHLAFSDSEDLYKWIDKNTPKNLYHSSSYYLFPERPMDDKVWQGADLIFDIDLDHIAEYKPKMIWICRNCFEVYKKTQDRCDKCSNKIDVVPLLDMDDYIYAKNELNKLVNILLNKIGFSLDQIYIYFSGGRGFHVHIISEDIKFLDQRSRMEIKDYITYDAYNVLNTKLIDGELLDALIDIINKKITNDEHKMKLLNALRNNIQMKQFIKIIKHNKYILDMINNYIKKKFGVCIDGVVTIDLSRLIRAPYSLHGKTSLVKTKIELDALDEFSPFKDAIGLKDKTKFEIKIIYMPNIIWDGKEYDEVVHTTEIIPRDLAIFLLCRGLAYDARKI